MKEGDTVSVRLGGLTLFGTVEMAAEPLSGGDPYAIVRWASFTQRFPQGDLQTHTQGPYPMCWGNPTKAACLAVGYCTRNPACNE